ncbi:hypothetical protein OC834_001538 [Tilletia horrida]|nr:hypothetical protein OC834_001538 [Tilletia horrida]
MSLREIPVRYHHSHNLSTGSTGSSGSSSSSGGSELSTPPSSTHAHSHSHSPFRKKRPTTSADSTHRKSPPNSPRSGGFFRHKFSGDNQTSSSSVGSSTLVSVELSRIESAGVTPTQATFGAPQPQQQAANSQSWFHRHHNNHNDKDEDAKSDDSFGCGLATEFDRHVGVLRADPSSLPLSPAAYGRASSGALPAEPILAAAWKAKLSQADERQSWLDSVFFRLQARAEGGVSEEEWAQSPLHHHHHQQQQARAWKKGHSGSGSQLVEAVGMERGDSSGSSGGAPSAPSTVQKGTSPDSFLDISRMINPCPAPGTVYVSKYAHERKAAAAAAAAGGTASSPSKVPTLTPKPSKVLTKRPHNLAHFSDFVFPPPAAGEAGAPSPPQTAAMNITPKAPQMQRFASSDHILSRSRTASSSVLRQTAMANAAASHRLSQAHCNLPPLAQMDATMMRGLVSPTDTSSPNMAIPPPPPHYPQRSATQQRPATSSRQSSMQPPMGRQRSQSDASRRNRSGLGSGDATNVMVPVLPDWAKQANRTLHRSRPSAGGSGTGSGSDTASASGESVSVRSRRLASIDTPSELPYCSGLAAEYLEPEPMARAVSHDTRLHSTSSRPALLSRASSNSLRRQRMPEALRIAPVSGSRGSRSSQASTGSLACGIDMEVSLSSPGCIMTGPGSRGSSSRESFGSSTSHSTTSISSPLTPRTPDYYVAPLPAPMHLHYPGTHMAMSHQNQQQFKENIPTGKVTVVRSNAFGIVELDADDENALLSGTGRFALASGSPLAQKLVAEHQSRHGLEYLSTLPKPKFLSPKSLSPTSGNGTRKQPLLDAKELMHTSRQLDFEATP